MNSNVSRYKTKIPQPKARIIFGDEKDFFFVKPNKNINQNRKFGRDITNALIINNNNNNNISKKKNSFTSMFEDSKGKISFFKNSTNKIKNTQKNNKQHSFSHHNHINRPVSSSSLMNYTKKNNVKKEFTTLEKKVNLNLSLKSKSQTQRINSKNNKLRHSVSSFSSSDFNTNISNKQKEITVNKLSMSNKELIKKYKPPSSYRNNNIIKNNFNKEPVIKSFEIDENKNMNNIYNENQNKENINYFNNININNKNIENNNINRNNKVTIKNFSIKKDIEQIEIKDNRYYNNLLKNKKKLIEKNTNEKIKILNNKSISPKNSIIQKNLNQQKINSYKIINTNEINNFNNNNIYIQHNLDSDRENIEKKEINNNKELIKNLNNYNSNKIEFYETSIKYIDISKIEENIQIPKEYLNNIYYNLLLEENEGIIPKPEYNYMKNQKEINEQMRSILVDWLIDVHLKFNFTDETLHMTVLIIDRYLTIENVNRNKLQLLGITALMIACKHEEIDLPKVDDFIYITDNAYTRDEVFEMENNVLVKLNFSFLIPSPIKFYELLSLKLNFNKKQFYMGKYLMECFLIDLKYIKYNASIISCACSYIVMKFFKLNNYSETYNKKYFTLNPEQIEYSIVKDCAKDICLFVDNINKTNYISIFKKYSKPEFENVALLILGR